MSIITRIYFNSFQLIDYEPKAQLQVPLLLRLGEEQVALNKAVESGNTDLVYTVILHLREHMPLSDFQVVFFEFLVVVTVNQVFKNSP